MMNGKAMLRWSIIPAAALMVLAGVSASDASVWSDLFGSSKPKPAPAVNWQRTADGVIVTPKTGAAHKVRLVVMTDSIIRVTAVPGDSFDLPKSLMVRAAPAATEFEVAAGKDMLTLKTDKVTAEVSLDDGKVHFLDPAGKPVLTSVNSGEFKPEKVDGKPFYAIRQEFNRGTKEGFYGLGQHQNGQMNYNGEDVVLAQHNMDVAVPFVVSTKDYGVLWDNYSITRFGYPEEYPPMSAELTLYDANGKKGGLTASYYDGNKLLVRRTESDPNYQYINDTHNFPPQVANPKHVKVRAGDPVPTSRNLKVIWDGSLQTQKTGMHKFRFYVSGYFKLWIDGKLVMNAWRQGWQGWYRDFQMPMTAGKKVAFRAEWRNEGSAYLRFLHIDPMPYAERHELSLHSDVAKAIDYYYVAGNNMDGVIAGYRHLTGQAPLMPKWSYGFWQSRQRYETQKQLVDTFKKYRRLHLPIDNIVQDWRYWPDPEWGSHNFDKTRFPHPQKMFDDIHDMHGHLMIVIWPKFYYGIPNYEAFAKKGLVYQYAIKQDYRDWVGPGYRSTNYDAYSPEARDIYWQQVQKKLDVLGPDAWWMDNDEPDIHSNMDIEDQIKMRDPNVLGPGAEYYNSYPLEHVCGFYDHWEKAHPEKRAFILTRSGFGGIQRCGAAIWSGDIAARWSDMRDQISAGVNFSMSGIPNWTFDIGGYTMEQRYLKPNAANLKEWQELYTRWFEFGAFAPIFRSHGEMRPREIYNISKPGTPVYNILKFYDRLRYRLLPYIYTAAADTYYHSGTIMRGLVMDFPNDLKVRDINDEYLLGHAFLVAPVTAYKARSRSVYLPAGVRWYDFFTGKVYDGGQQITADAPLEHMPIFVKEGSIVPTGPRIEYTGQKPKAPLTLFVYTGKDGRFSLYEDDGTSNAYKEGEYSRIPIRYDDATGTLTIGARKGSYAGMVADRTFNIRWITGPSKTASSFTAKPDATVHYTGAAVSVVRPQG